MLGHHFNHHTAVEDAEPAAREWWHRAWTTARLVKVRGNIAKTIT